MLKKIFISCIALLGISHLQASDFNGDMNKLRESYTKNYISMSIQYKLYSKATDVKPSETNSLWIESFGNLLHYKGQGQDVLYTESQLLMVDEDEKEMILDTVTSFYNQANYEVFPVDTAVARMQSITSSELPNGNRRYTLIPKDKSEASKIILDINVQNWTLMQVEIHGGNDLGGGKVIIQYSQVVKQTSSPQGSFKLNTYLSPKKGGGYVTNSLYKSYQFFQKSNQFKNK